jgi:thioredoxin-related protein
MTKTITIIALFIITLATLNAQTPADTTGTFAYPEKGALPKPYHPEENASQKLKELIQQARKSHKNILIQAGGNWCIWCLRFNYFVQTVPELKSILDKNYLYYHLNFSPENKNEAVFAKYVSKDQHYGYPFFIILSGTGKLLCVQESGGFEAGKGYNADKIKQFLGKWAPK